MAARETAVLRRFNRTWSQRVGALDASFLGTGRPLGPSRLLFEIGAGGGRPPTVLALRERTGLDSGYLSRLLASLQDEGLVELVEDPEDRRRRRVRLTSRGRGERRRLDRRSEELARRLVDPLGPRQRERLAEALATADLLVRAATIVLEPVDPAGDAARAATRAYFAELDDRFPGGFDPEDAEAADAAAMRPGSGGRFLVAMSDGEPVACGGVQDLGDGVGEVKRMWVHRDWRGVGLGRRLLVALEDEARALGFHALRLDTNRSLGEALALYASAGYAEIARYNDNRFAQAFFEKGLAD